MKRKITAIAAALILGTLGFILIAYLPRLKRSTLGIHVSGASWTRVIVRSSNLKEEKVFRPADVLVVSPIEHGRYGISIEYSTGDRLWTEFLHTDAGARRRIDLYFDASATTNLISVRETANGNKVLYEGHTTPKETSEDKPLRLDWI